MKEAMERAELNIEKVRLELIESYQKASALEALFLQDLMKLATELSNKIESFNFAIGQKNAN
jgi:hypothetical protein